MSKSIADLRGEPKEREERSMSVCLAPHLVAEMQSLSERLATLRPEGEQEGPKRKAGPKLTEAHKLTEQMSALLDRMAEHEGELRLRANLTDGEWRRWCNEHPARAEGEPGYERDLRVAAGFCNADALIDDLGSYAYQWNGERLGPDDWAEVLDPRVSPPDKAAAATEVVSMYEARRDFRQWRSNLSASLRESSGSDSPAA